MGKFSGCLLASDYDGTLADAHGNITEDVREALRYFIAQGGYFTVCTGRTKQGFHAFSPDIMNAPVLLANGIMAYDYLKRRTVFCDGIGAADAQLANEIRNRFPDICIELYSEDFQTYAIHLNDRSRDHFTRQDIAWTEIGDVHAAQGPFVKIMLSCGEARGREIQRWLDQTIDGYNVKYIPSVGEYVEIIRKGADKGAGMLRLADALGVPKDRVFAIGDGENDIDMLNAAALGFVPENGCAQAKAAGDIIVRSHNNGAAAHVIEILDRRF